MPTALQGRNYNNVKDYRLSEIIYATDGFAFNHATEAGNIGLRTSGKLTRKPVGPTDAAKRPIVDQVEVNIEATGLQTGLLNLKNAVYLCSHYHQLRVKDSAGRYFNFVDFAGTFGTPTGSTLLGLDFEWVLGQSERTQKYMWKANMANTVWDYILTNSTAAASGGASGTSGGLTASAYARSAYKRSNIKDITIDGISIGVKKDFKLTLKSQAVNNDEWNRPLSRAIMCEMEVIMLQTDKDDLLGVSTTAEQLDKAIVITTAEDETITFAAGALGVYGETESGDENAFTKLTFAGEFPISSGINIASATAATFSLVGY